MWKLLLAIAVVVVPVEAMAKDKLLPVKCGISSRSADGRYQSMNWKIFSYGKSDFTKGEIENADFSQPNDGFFAIIPNSNVKVMINQSVDFIGINQVQIDAAGKLTGNSVSTSHNLSTPGEIAEMHADFIGLDGRPTGWQVSCRFRQ